MDTKENLEKRRRRKIMETLDQANLVHIQVQSILFIDFLLGFENKLGGICSTHMMCYNVHVLVMYNNIQNIQNGNF